MNRRESAVDCASLPSLEQIKTWTKAAAELVSRVCLIIWSANMPRCHLYEY